MNADVRVGFGLQESLRDQGFKLQASKNHGLGPRTLPYGRTPQALVTTSAVNLGSVRLGFDPASWYSETAYTTIVLGSHIFLVHWTRLL